MNVVDEDTIIQLKELMGEDFSLLVNTFIKDTSAKIASINDAIASDNAELVRADAHGLKGSALNLSAKKLTELSYSLEMKGKDNNLDGAAQILAELEDEYRAVTGYLVSL